MLYRPLGRTGLKVSVVCLGTMTWGRQNTEAEGHEQMDYALAHGVNFFDTAEMYAVPPNAETYGKTEQIIGSWFKKSGNREKVILASKVAGSGLPWVRGGKAVIDRSNIKAAVEGSLKRLQTDYIDLYQLHWPNRGSYAFNQLWNYAPKIDGAEIEDNFLEVLETLEDLVEEGKIRYAGLSNESAWGTMKWLQLSKEHNLPRMASIQNEYSLLYRLFEPDMHEVAVTEDIGLLAWSPLATGMLSGKYLDGKRPAGSRWTLLSNGSARDTEQANKAVRAYMDVARKHGLDICQMALSFVNSRPFVTSNIIGATTMSQLKANIGSIDVTLTPEVFKDIDKVRRDFPIPY